MARHIDFQTGWPQIQAAIDKLEVALEGGTTAPAGGPGKRGKSKLFPNKTYMKIYTRCYDMCTQRPPHNYSQRLYEAHGERIETYLRTVGRQALAGKQEDQLLKELQKRWGNHLIMNKWLFKFFNYLDRYYVDQHGQPKLKEAGLMAFRRLFSDFVQPAVEASMNVVDRDRNGEYVEHGLVQTVVEIFETLGHGLEFYKNAFEARLVDRTRDYYRHKAGELLDTLSTPAYLAQAEIALDAEKNRITSYLHRSSEQVVLRTAETELLSRNEQALLENTTSGVQALLRNEKLDDLSRVFRLFSRLPDGLKGVARIFKQHVQEQGLAVVRKREATVASAGGKESSSDPTFVRALLELHDKFKTMVEQQFNGHSLFQKVLKEAFELFVNKEIQSKYTNAEMVSAFCDRILKTGGARLSDTQVEELLSRIVQLFTFISDKDHFALHYRNALAKRLLNQRSASDDAERSMISKLKLRCGAQFTGKMEGMLADLQLGSEHARKFSAYQDEHKDDCPPFQFTVQVLTTGFWPSYKAIDVLLPDAVSNCHTLFRSYYDTVTNHRKLQWVHSLGTAIVKGRFSAGDKDLQVSTLQMVALLFFNNTKGKLGFGDVRESLGLQEEICKRVLHSLSCGKYKLLRKTPKSRSINTTDQFEFNAGFSCPFRKVRIPMASLEDSSGSKNLKQDRSIAIEAAAVRTMKARKVLSHQELVSEIITQLHFFHPNPKVIKRRIETLIEREYLERDPENPHMYRYLA